MKKKPSKKVFSKISDIVSVIVIISLFSLLYALGLFQRFDYSLYDLLLGLKQDSKVRNEILFVEIDNKSLESLGPWPWNRDILANSLLRMKELGAETAVFDIEYLSPSNLSVNPKVTDDITNAIDIQKKDISDIVFELAAAAESNMYTSSEFANLTNEAVQDYIYPGLDSLRQTITESAYIDNDDFFSKTIQFFGNTWLTINVMDLEIKYENAFIDYTKKRCLFTNIEDINLYTKRGNLYYLVDQGGQNKLGFSPAREQFMKCAKGAGFTNVVLDKDGTRRRVELLSDQNSYFAAQLVFAPILKKINPEKIIRTKHYLKLINATDIDTGKKNNIKIPLDSNGRMLINWLNKEFIDSFRHESVVMLYQLDEIENKINYYLETLNGFNLWDKNGNPLSYKAEVSTLCNDYKNITTYKKYLLSKCKGYDINNNPIEGGIEDSEYEDYFNARQTFFDNVSSFIDGSYFDEIIYRLDEMKLSMDAINYEETKNGILQLYENLKHEDELYRSTFNQRKAAYKNSFCIIGNTASSTTDLGSTPFNRAYPNVGTHANVYNTIINNDYITPIDGIYGIIFAVILSFSFIILLKNKKLWIQNTLGSFAVIISVATPVLLMIFFGIYVPTVCLVLITFTSFLASVIIHFRSSEKDKSVLRNAFSTYLNPVVVEQIVKDPSILKLGGEEKRITALFSDIKNFSSFSELVTPSKLVSILNDYLGSMSDCILKEGGTLDKYIGDSIVSFFGAPLDLKNTALSACTAAIRMKQVEEVFNKKNEELGTVDHKLYTRIGINTGNMVVGNMGTKGKMNYTIMGDAVNLASRLEGVNKVYKSWILCSDTTWNEINYGEYRDSIIARKLDKVRVVGRDEPVQLYNILGFANELSEIQFEATELYKQAMDKYIEKDFATAGKLFIKANNLIPEDETPLIFAQRCKDYIQNGLPKNWDGIMNLTTK